MEPQISTNESLDIKQQNIVSIASYTATGNIDKLKPALETGLDARLSVNEIKEILVQLYAYCGFPRSLNALNAFLSVTGERKVKGIQDVEGKEASPIADTAKKHCKS